MTHLFFLHAYLHFKADKANKVQFLRLVYLSLFSSCFVQEIFKMTILCSRNVLYPAVMCVLPSVMYVVTAPPMRPLGLTQFSVVCAPVTGNMETRNKGRSFKGPAYGNDILKLPGRMLIVMVICGRGSPLLGAGSES